MLFFTEAVHGGTVQRQMEKGSVLLLLGLAGFMVMADNWVISPILPAISKSLHVDIPTAGLLITAYMIPFGIFQIVFGPLADRYGKKQVITTAMVMFTLATGLCALGTGLGSVGFFRAITGVFAASVMPISFALVGDIFPLQERQQAIGTFIGISFLGQGVSMALGGSIAYMFDWRAVFLAYALLSLLPTVLLLKNYRGIPSEKNPDSDIVKPYLELLSSSGSLLTYLLIVLEGYFIIGSFSFGGSYVSLTHHYDSLHIGLVMTGFGIMSVIGGRLSGKISGLIGPPRVLRIGLLLAASGDLMIHFLGSSIAAFVAGVATLGFGFILTHSTLVTRATEFAQKSRGAAMSLVAFCFMGSGGVGTALGGRIIASYGIDSIFLIYGLGLFATMLCAWAFVRAADHDAAADQVEELVDYASEESA
jgi:predicted MFS family arabinose efflux permease